MKQELQKVTLGEYLRGLRLCQSDMSLEKMAQKVGCAKSYLSDVENDKVMPTLAKAAVMAAAYKTSLNQMGRYL
jgi:transcriptional regulator with XRE-family HTH domain